MKLWVMNFHKMYQLCFVYVAVSSLFRTLR